MTTDGASNMVFARGAGLHSFVGLPVVYDGSCVDHTVHLVLKDVQGQRGSARLKDALENLSALIKYLKESHLALESLLQCQEDLGMKPKSPIQGTSNRWFHERNSAEVMLALKPALEAWLMSFDIPAYLEELEEEEWALLRAYVEATEPFLFGVQDAGRGDLCHCLECHPLS